MSVDTIYWSYDDITRTLNISGDPVTATSLNGSYSIDVNTSENIDTPQVIKHFLSNGAYVESGGDYFVPWGSVIGDIKIVNISDLTPLYVGEWFDGGASIETWNLQNVDFSSGRSFAYTFQSCKTIPSMSDVTVSSEATSLKGMFYLCAGTKNLDLTHWDVSNVTNVYNMFRNNYYVESINASGWDTSNITDMGYMFSSNYKLKTLNVSGWDTSSVTNMEYMFYRAERLEALDVSGWDVGNVTNMGSMFNGANSLVTLDVTNWDTSKVTSMNHMFSSWYDEGSQGDIEKALTTLNVSNWDVSNVTDISFMFNRCKNLTSLNVANWNTSKVTDMSKTFRLCAKLTSLNVANWNVGNVTNMNQMFNGTIGLTSLNVANWDTSNVTDMSYLFGAYYTASSTIQVPLSSLNVSNWNTSKVVSMDGLFQGRINITSLDVANWNVSNVTSMNRMFGSIGSNATYGMKLQSLHLEKWRTTNLISTDRMFYNCPLLSTIYVGRKDLDVSDVTSSTNMFYNCVALVGAIPFDSTKTNIECANSTNGYFTAVATTDDFSHFVTKTNVLSNTHTWYDILFAGKAFVAVGNGVSAHSYDGSEWEEQTAFMGSESAEYGLVHDGVNFIATTKDSNSYTVNYYTSSDGTNWQRGNIEVCSGLSTMPSGNHMIAFCDKAATYRYLFLSNNTNKIRAKSTLDSELWDLYSTPSTSYKWSSIFSLPDKFILVAKDTSTSYIKQIAYSVNGSTWANSTIPTSYNWIDAKVIKNELYLIASNGYVKSSNGISWGSFTSSTSKPMGYGASVYLGSNSTRMVVSSNMPTWVNTDLTDVTWASHTFGNGDFVLLKSNGTIAKTLTSRLTLYVKADNQWLEGSPYIKANNTWMEPSGLFIKQNNTWTEI